MNNRLRVRKVRLSRAESFSAGYFVIINHFEPVIFCRIPAWYLNNSMTKCGRQIFWRPPANPAGCSVRRDSKPGRKRAAGHKSDRTAPTGLPGGIHLFVSWATSFLARKLSITGGTRGVLVNKLRRIRHRGAETAERQKNF